uniref:Uncharacterized protein n=1 Tax=Anguilla anguilla TaxID=7936 RepID=A0A0E9WM25_ANGAN
MAGINKMIRTPGSECGRSLKRAAASCTPDLGGASEVTERGGESRSRAPSFYVMNQGGAEGPPQEA